MTGATGFIGGQAVKVLYRKGFNIFIIVRQSSNISHLINFLPKENIKIFSTLDKLIDELRGRKYHAIINLASSVPTFSECFSISDILNTNIIFCSYIAELCKVLKIERFINFGTFSQHYKNYKYNPRDFYAASKQAFYNILYYYSTNDFFKVLNLEPSNVYGNGNKKSDFISCLFESTKKGVTFKTTSCKQMVDFIHVNDISAAILYSIMNFNQILGCSKFRVYSLRTNNFLNLKSVILVYKRVIDKNLKVLYSYYDINRKEFMFPPTVEEVLPGWKAEISLEEGLLLNIG